MAVLLRAAGGSLYRPRSGLLHAVCLVFVVVLALDLFDVGVLRRSRSFFDATLQVRVHTPYK